MNVQGEEQKKLDVISNDVLKNALRSTGKPYVRTYAQQCVLVSESEKEIGDGSERVREPKNERESEDRLNAAVSAAGIADSTRRCWRFGPICVVQVCS